MIEDLLARAAYPEAAAMSRRLLGDSAALWERWAYTFAHARKLLLLAPYMPTGAACGWGVCTWRLQQHSAPFSAPWTSISSRHPPPLLTGLPCRVASAQAPGV